MYRNVSLVDELEKEIPKRIKEALGGTAEKDYEDYDNELFLKQARGLRIGLCHRRTKLYAKDTDKAMCYADQFRNVDDLVAAIILSSYIPGTTGPWKGKRSKHHAAVARASEVVKEMEDLGFIKIITTKDPINVRQSMARGAVLSKLPNTRRRESYIDGAIGDFLPVADKDTLLVSPFYFSHEENALIAPSCNCAEKGRRRKWLKVLPKKVTYKKTQVSICDCAVDNLKLGLSRSASDEDVDRIFQEGRNLTLKYFSAAEKEEEVGGGCVPIAEE